ncbi:YgiT-type zinc finger protein [Chloroherpeton thalassium]
MICENGTAKPCFAAFTLERGNAIVVFKNVPAPVCENCGDFFCPQKSQKS